MTHSTFAGRCLMTLAATGVLVSAHAAQATPTPQQQCQKRRYEAAARYGACQQKVLAKYLWGGDIGKFDAAVAKCTAKYIAKWPKVQASGAAPCSGNRFVDNGNETVTDNLTGLQWEKKTNGAGVHNVNNFYTWSNTGTAADGTAFTVFLSALNSGGCFAGQCDWRLPTFIELQTILARLPSQPYSCAAEPCIDSIFGPTEVDVYWSSTTNASAPSQAWNWDFFQDPLSESDPKAVDYLVRAVRGGL